MDGETQLLIRALAWVVMGLGVGLAGRALCWDRARGVRRCPKCWYIMDGVDSLRCPECGQTAKSPRALMKTRRRWGWAGFGVCVVLGGYTLGRGPEIHAHGKWVLAPNTVLILIMPMIDDGIVIKDWREAALAEFMRRLSEPGSTSGRWGNTFWLWQWRHLLGHSMRCVSDEAWSTEDRQGSRVERAVSGLHRQIIEVALAEDLLTRCGLEQTFVERFPPHFQDVHVPDTSYVGAAVPFQVSYWQAFRKEPFCYVSVLCEDHGQHAARVNRNVNELSWRQVAGYIEPIHSPGACTLRLQVQALSPPGGSESVGLMQEPLASIDVARTVQITEPVAETLRPMDDAVLQRSIQESLQHESTFDDGVLSVLLTLRDNDVYRISQPGDRMCVQLMRDDDVQAWAFVDAPFEAPMLAFKMRIGDVPISPAARDGDTWTLRVFNDPAVLRATRLKGTYWPGEIVVPIDWSKVRTVTDE